MQEPMAHRCRTNRMLRGSAAMGVVFKMCLNRFIELSLPSFPCPKDL